MHIDQALLKKYFQGTCTSEELQQLEDALAKKGLTFDDLLTKADWEDAREDAYHSEQEIWARIQQQLLAPEPKPTFPWIKRISQLAAVGILAFLVYSTFLQEHKQPQAISHSAPKEKPLEAVEASGNLFYINSSNQDMMVYTSDSSKIILSPGSEVRFAEHFQHLPERAIQLKGKGTFYVRKNKEQPFRVYSKNLITTALGTTFVVDEFSKEATLVKLLEGKIEVKEVQAQALANSPALLVRNFTQTGELLLNHQERKIVREIKPNLSNENRNGSFQEENGKIMIKNLSLQDILIILQHNFNIKLQTQGYLATNNFFSGTFKKSPTVYQEIIQEINYLHKTNNQIIKQ